MMRSYRSAVAAIALAIAASAAAAQTSPTPPPACDTPEHRQFDFWVGRWDVYRADTGRLVAHSLIEKVYGDCAVRENWMPLQGTGGGSLTIWRPAEARWRQVWTDSGNHLNEYSGGMEGEDMVLTGVSTDRDGNRLPVRMIFRRGEAGSVLQIGEQSDDGGASWRLRYHFTYRPAVVDP